VFMFGGLSQVLCMMNDVVLLLQHLVLLDIRQTLNMTSQDIQGHKI